MTGHPPITDKERLGAIQSVIAYDADVFNADELTDRENDLLDAIILERREMRILKEAVLEHYKLHEFTLSCANDGVPPPCGCSICCAVRSLK